MSIVQPPVPRNLWEKASLVIGGGWLTKTGNLQCLKPLSADGQFEFSRNSTVWIEGENNSLVQIEANIPVLRWSASRQRWEFHPQIAATNQIRNNTMQGASAGSPGTLPTSWQDVNGGLTRQILQVGVIGNIEFIEIRYSGVATGSNVYVMLDVPGSATSQNTNHAISAYINRNGSLLPNNIAFGIEERNISNAYLRESFNLIATTADFQRLSTSRPVADSNVAFARPFARFFLTVGQNYDFTVRIGVPQMEVGTNMTSVIKTGGSIGSRSGDACFKSSIASSIGQSEGNIYCEVNINNSDVTTIRSIFGINDGTTSNRISIRRDTNGRIVVIVVVSNTTVAFVQSSPGQIGFLKIAVSYKVGALKLFINGSLVDTASPISIPTCNRVDLGKVEGTGVTNQFNDSIGLIVLNKEVRNDQQNITDTTL